VIAPLRLACWNVNHRVGMTRFRPEAAAAAAALDADVCLLTEYFPREGGPEFEARLAEAGYRTLLLSRQVAVRANRVLSAARVGVELDPDIAPLPADPQLQSNVLGLRVVGTPLRILALRIPWYPASARAALEAAWDWMEVAADRLRDEAAVIVGDLNVRPASPVARGGQHFRRILGSGWHSATDNAATFFPRDGEPGPLDYLLHTTTVRVTARVVLKSGRHRLAGSAAALSDHAAITAAVRLVDGGGAAGD
jgi:endonuclease/exonuclease/phosphatase family metal-dependent hydrolase